MTIWQLTDGKPGHENQTSGLIQAIERRQSVESFRIGAPDRFESMRMRLMRNFPPGSSLPAPDLVVAAGHRTHIALLAAQAARGGRTVVLMKPTLPVGWFDFCLCPEHDQVSASPSLLATSGVLNKIAPESCVGDPQQGLILVGGPSSHYDWDNEQVISQICQLLCRSPESSWTLSTSRRTPLTFTEQIKTVEECASLSVVTGESTSADWLPAQLKGAGTVFVTEDSVSMLYESLTAGANVGLLAVPRRKSSRVIDGVDQLVEQRQIIPFDQWCTHGFSARKRVALAEADRAAEWILNRLNRVA